MFRMGKTRRWQFCGKGVYIVCMQLLGFSSTTSVLNISGQCPKFMTHFEIFTHTVSAINSNAYSQGAAAALDKIISCQSGSLLMYRDSLLNLSVFPPFAIKLMTRANLDQQHQ